MQSDANPLAKRSGCPCRNPAVRGWSVCRMYGAGGGYGSGKGNSASKHGIGSRGYVEMRKAINDLVRTEREVATLINDSPDEDCFNPPD